MPALSDAAQQKVKELAARPKGVISSEVYDYLRRKRLLEGRHTQRDVQRFLSSQLEPLVRDGRSVTRGRGRAQVYVLHSDDKDEKGYGFWVEATQLAMSADKYD